MSKGDSMFDVIKAIDDIIARAAKEYGDIHKQETTQHEKHLTWVTSHYAKELGLPPSDSSDSNKPYFGQAYNNLTFKIGYRIGIKEGFESGKGGYEQGYKDAMSRVKSILVREIDG